jgi:hypothetical protein
MVQTLPNHHLTSSRVRKNTKWSKYVTIDITDGPDNSNISSNGRATQKATTHGNQQVRFTPQN